MRALDRDHGRSACRRRLLLLREGGRRPDRPTQTRCAKRPTRPRRAALGRHQRHLDRGPGAGGPGYLAAARRPALGANGRARRDPRPAALDVSSVAPTPADPGARRVEQEAGARERFHQLVSLPGAARHHQDPPAVVRVEQESARDEGKEDPWKEHANIRVGDSDQPIQLDCTEDRRRSHDDASWIQPHAPTALPTVHHETDLHLGQQLVTVRSLHRLETLRPLSKGGHLEIFPSPRILRGTRKHTHRRAR